MRAEPRRNAGATNKRRERDLILPACVRTVHVGQTNKQKKTTTLRIKELFALGVLKNNNNRGAFFSYLHKEHLLALFV